MLAALHSSAILAPTSSAAPLFPPADPPSFSLISGVRVEAAASVEPAVSSMTWA